MRARARARARARVRVRGEGEDPSRHHPSGVLYSTLRAAARVRPPPRRTLHHRPRAPRLSDRRCPPLHRRRACHWHQRRRLASPSARSGSHPRRRRAPGSTTALHAPPRRPPPLRRQRAACRRDPLATLSSTAPHAPPAERRYSGRRAFAVTALPVRLVQPARARQLRVAAAAAPAAAAARMPRAGWAGGRRHPTSSCRLLDLSELQVLAAHRAFARGALRHLETHSPPACCPLRRRHPPAGVAGTQRAQPEGG